MGIKGLSRNARRPQFHEICFRSYDAVMAWARLYRALYRVG